LCELVEGDEGGAASGRAGDVAECDCATDSGEVHATADGGADGVLVGWAFAADEIDPGHEAGVGIVGPRADVGQIEVGVGVDEAGEEDGGGAVEGGDWEGGCAETVADLFWISDVVDQTGLAIDEEGDAWVGVGLFGLGGGGMLGGRVLGGRVLGGRVLGGCEEGGWIEKGAGEDEEWILGV
jgi:hypothetical protein